MSDKLTNKIVTEMLTESTGKDAMDSGGIYGRHWEKNQIEILQGNQPCDFFINDKTKETELTPTIPIFDYLTKATKYTEECQMLEELLPNLNFSVLHYIEDIIEHPSDYDEELQVFEENQVFGSKVGSTYNGEDALSQGFQYIWFEYDGDDYIGISIHNGCDIRGGYTDIHIFQVEWAEEMWFAKSEPNIYCKCGMHNYKDSTYQMEYWLFEDKVNPKFIYEHSYKDKNGNLRCKHCNELIISEMPNF